jgi:hypothetical protein
MCCCISTSMFLIFLAFCIVFFIFLHVFVLCLVHNVVCVHTWFPLSLMFIHYLTLYHRNRITLCWIAMDLLYSRSIKIVYDHPLQIFSESTCTKLGRQQTQTTLWTRHRTKTCKNIKNTIQKAKKMRNMDVDIQQHIYKVKHCNL